MGQVTPFPVTQRRNINWGKWALISIGLFFSVLLLVVPIIWIFITAFEKGLGEVLVNLSNPDMLHAIGLTLLIALITVPVNLVLA